MLIVMGDLKGYSNVDDVYNWKLNNNSRKPILRLLLFFALLL